MKIKTSLIKVIFSILYISLMISCSNGNDSFIENDSSDFNTKALYLTKRDNEVCLGYKNFDVENLHKKTGKSYDSDKTFLPVIIEKGLLFFEIAKK